MNKFNEVENAIISVLNHQSEEIGRGVLVNGNIIITAAHLVDFECDGSMVTGSKHYIENIRTSQGDSKVTPLLVDPISDIAVLGSLYEQTLYDYNGESDAFIDYCDKTKPAQLFMDDLVQMQEHPIYLYNHRRIWISGSIKWCNNYPMLSIMTKEKIECGASGSPIINKSGELVGIISASHNHSFSETDNRYFGRSAYIKIVLPIWIMNRILD